MIKKLWPLLIPATFFLLLILLAGPLLLMKKVVVFLCLPAGLVWVALAFALFLPKLSIVKRVSIGFIWLVYTLGGNPLVGNKLLAPLEKPYAKFAEPTEPFDIIFVLGGGTSSSLTDQAQVSSAGDRIVKAGRLYSKGMTKKLGASGRSITEVGADRNLAEETISIWEDFGIPRSDTIAFTKPRNTREEIIEYRNYLDSLPEKPQRVGICTSAWHMKRAEKIWRANGLDAIPVPADFRSRPIPLITTYLIPKKRGFAHVQVALWEYLGLLFD